MESTENPWCSFCVLEITSATRVPLPAGDRTFIHDHLVPVHCAAEFLCHLEQGRKFIAFVIRLLL